MSETIEKRLAELGVTLPTAAAPAANYLPFAQTRQSPVHGGAAAVQGRQARGDRAARPRSRHGEGSERRNSAPSTSWRRSRRRSAILETIAPHRQDHRLRRLDAGLHRTASRRQRRLGPARRGARRRRQARALGGRHGVAAAQRAGRNRSDRRSRLTDVHMTDLSWLTDRPIAHRGFHDMNRPRLGEHAVGLWPRDRRGLCHRMRRAPLADGVPVVFHDDELKRLTGSGRLRLAADGGRTGRAADRRHRRPCPDADAMLDLVAGRCRWSSN